MSFDELQNEWQSHDHGTRLNIDADVLLKEVRRKHHEFEAILFGRDVVEIVAAGFVTCGFTFFAIFLNEWTLYLCALGGLFVGTFFIVDRWIQHRRHPASEDSLQSCIQASLIQVNHQIWLLKNIFWWYLLPLFIGVPVFLGSIGWKMRDGGIGAVLIPITISLGGAWVFWRTYCLNQTAVKKTLEPRRDELKSMLAHLDRVD